MRLNVMLHDFSIFMLRTISDKRSKKSIVLNSLNVDPFGLSISDRPNISNRFRIVRIALNPVCCVYRREAVYFPIVMLKMCLGFCYFENVSGGWKLLFCELLCELCWLSLFTLDRAIYRCDVSRDSVTKFLTVTEKKHFPCNNNNKTAHQNKPNKRRNERKTTTHKLKKSAFIWNYRNRMRYPSNSMENVIVLIVAAYDTNEWIEDGV